VQDDVELRMTRIELCKVAFLKLFLADVWDGKQTFYDKLEASGMKLLATGGTDGPG
jgi:hypothetical protein